MECLTAGPYDAKFAEDVGRLSELRSVSLLNTNDKRLRGRRPDVVWTRINSPRKGHGASDCFLLHALDSPSVLH